MSFTQCSHSAARVIPEAPGIISSQSPSRNLMGGEHKHPRQSGMGRRFGGVEGNIGYVITGERLDSFVDVVGSVVVAVGSGYG